VIVAERHWWSSERERGATVIHIKLLGTDNQIGGARCSGIRRDVAPGRVALLPLSREPGGTRRQRRTAPDDTSERHCTPLDHRVPRRTRGSFEPHDGVRARPAKNEAPLRSPGRRRLPRGSFRNLGLNRCCCSTAGSGVAVGETRGCAGFLWSCGEHTADFTPTVDNRAVQGPAARLTTLFVRIYLTSGFS
jgi:hypothetical protein